MKNMIAVLFLILCASTGLAQKQTENTQVDVSADGQIRLVLQVEEVLTSSGADMAQCITHTVKVVPMGMCEIDGNQILIAKNAVGYGLSIRGHDGTIHALWASWHDSAVKVIIVTPGAADRHDVAAQKEVVEFVHRLLTPQSVELAKSD